MSSRYDPAPPEPKVAEAQPAPLSPPVSNSGLVKSAVAVGIVAAIGISAAVFHFDLCEFLSGVGVTVSACAVTPAPAPATSSPAQ